MFTVVLFKFVYLHRVIFFQKSRHHRLQEVHSGNVQVPVTDDGNLPLPTVKPGDEYIESEDDVDDDDEGDENEEEGEESAEVLEKQSEYSKYIRIS